jgi:hypothetical protein
MNILSRFKLGALMACIILFGCNPELVPLKNRYENVPTEISSSLSIDSSWARIAALFNAHGLPVKTIDRNKGLIMSEKTSFIPIYTFEGDNGKLLDPNAWVVLPKTLLKGKPWNPKTIRGEWTIQIAEKEKGTTSIKINPQVVCTFSPNMLASVETHAQSTGHLERLVKASLER